MNKIEEIDIVNLIRIWSEKFNQPISNTKEFTSIERMSFAFSLIVEEVEELRQSCIERDFKETQDALGDILWVTIRMMLELGIDPLKTIESIYDSNMSKLDYTIKDALITRDKYLEQNIETNYKMTLEGTFITFRKSDGKVLKSHNFQKPNFD